MKIELTVALKTNSYTNVFKNIQNKDLPLSKYHSIPIPIVLVS